MTRPALPYAPSRLIPLPTGRRGVEGGKGGAEKTMQAGKTLVKMEYRYQWISWRDAHMKGYWPSISQDNIKKRADIISPVSPIPMRIVEDIRSLINTQFYKRRVWKRVQERLMNEAFYESGP